MEAKIGNGAESPSVERKRSNAISLSAPDVSTKADEGAADLSVAPSDAPVVAGRTYTIIIPPMGESAVVGTALQGYTLIHMTNLGMGEAEAGLTWMGRSGPQIGQMFTNRPMGFEYYRDLFHGAKVAITNLSAEASIRIRVTLCP